jgi:hypothetical protein
MKVQKKVSVTGDFAKVNEDIRDGDIITINDGGTIIPGEWGERAAFKVQTRNGEKVLSFNQTSMNNLIDGYGDETGQWVGKSAGVFVVKQMVGDKLRNVCYLAPEGWTMNEEGKFAPGIGGKSIEYPDGDGINPDDIPFN